MSGLQSFGDESVNADDRFAARAGYFGSPTNVAARRWQVASNEPFKR